MMLSVLSIVAAMVAIVAADTWQIQSMTNHFMGFNSGIGNGQSWPVSEQYHSTMTFALQHIPNDEKSTTTFKSSECHGSWKNGTEPDNWFDCDDTRAKWRFQPRETWKECDFILEILFTDIKVGTSNTKAAFTMLSANITANQPGVSNSYLTCIGCPGGPYAGICGTTGGILSTKPPIPLTVTGLTVQDFSPFTISSLSAYLPSGRPGQPCMPHMQFNITDPNDPTSTTLCSRTWQCSDTICANDTCKSPLHLFQHVKCEDKSWSFRMTGRPWSNFVLYAHNALGSSPSFGSGGRSVHATISGKARIQQPAQSSEICAASGSCYWSLKEGVTVLVPIDSADYH